MFKTKHFVVITTLIVIAVCLLGAYLFGAFAVKVSILDSAKPSDYTVLSDAKTNSNIEINDKKLVSSCRYMSHGSNINCGFILNTRPSDVLEKGIDISNFDSLNIRLKALHNIDSPKIKITLKNFNSKYSSLEDPISAKFNSVVVELNKDATIYNIPIDFFQVESWWINKYGVSLQDSQVDISNVIAIEFLNRHITLTGLYEFEISKLELVGERLTLLQILAIILGIASIVIFLLIDEQRYNERQASFIDPLTRLHNRRGQAEWLKKHRISIHNPKRLSLIYMDIDDFKQANDTYGHHVGDLLLKGFTEKINSILVEKELSNFRVNFSRLSGDEFVVIGVDLSQSAVESLAKRFLESLLIPLILEEQEIKVNISVGIALGTITSTNLKDLFKQADSAMYYAKRRGKNQAKIYDDNVLAEQNCNQETAEIIKQAIASNAFTLHFLPIFDIKTKRVASVEVLISTEFEGLKNLSPTDYLPIAEEYGLIQDIDSWMLENTLKVLAENHDLIHNLSLTFLVTLSSIDIQDSHFTTTLSNLLTKYKVPAQCLALVIKETAFTVQTDSYTEHLQSMRDIGVGLVLGDFGTGFTALNHLLYYPIQTLKIDKSFVLQIGDKNYNSAAIIQAILKIAHTYNMNVIAEGVENLEQFYFLEEQGCEHIQGNLFSEPLTLRELAKALRNQHT